MTKKLLIVRYLGFNPEGELCTVGKLYPYLVSTKKKIKERDFVVLADKSQNEDRNVVSTVRVMKIADDKTEEEKVEKLLEECSWREPRNKIFVGKADLNEYFADIDLKRKKEELQKKIEARFKEAEKEALYRKLAETDPEMKALLSELDALR